MWYFNKTMVINKNQYGKVTNQPRPTIKMSRNKAPIPVEQRLLINILEELKEINKKLK